MGAIRIGTALEVRRKRVHRYTWRKMADGAIGPSVTLCGEKCDGWRRVRDEQWDKPPEDLERCPACEAKTR